MIVTRAEGNLLLELAGRPALERLEELVARRRPRRPGPLARRACTSASSSTSTRPTFGRGDFLVRNVLGADREARRRWPWATRSTVGTTVQFQVRDADAADEDLRALLAGRRRPTRRPGVHLQRPGQRPFGEPDHDAARGRTTRSAAGAVAGMFCAGELGPVGGRSFVHGFTAVGRRSSATGDQGRAHRRPGRASGRPLGWHAHVG